MLMKTYKRAESPAPTAKPAPPGGEGQAFRKERRLIQRPFPTLDVVEGNGEADWALWTAAVEEQGRAAR